MDFRTELLNSLKLAIDRKISRLKADKTYRSVVTEIDKKGYVILDETGNKRTVPCCIPNVALRVGQPVYVKEPMGNLGSLHICGVAEKYKPERG